MAFGERLQLLRRRSGLTQEQFAEQLQVSRQAVSKWESGKGYPEMEKLLFICRQYGVTLNDLFEQGENEPIPGNISGHSAEGVSCRLCKQSLPPEISGWPPASCWAWRCWLALWDCA